MKTCIYNSEECAVLSKDTLYHLSVDRSLERLCPDLFRREALWKALSTLSRSPEEIKLRQGILQELLQVPALLSKLSPLLERFCLLRDTHEQERRELMRGGSSHSVANAKQLLESTALTLKRSLLFMQAIGDVLEQENVRSHGLQALWKRIRAITEPPEFAELLRLCTSLESFSERGFADQRITLNREGKIAAVELVAHGDLQIADPALTAKKRLFRRKESQTATNPCMELTPFARPGLWEELLIAPRKDLAKLLSGYARVLFEEFCPLKEALAFYEAAVAFCHRLEEQGIPYCFPAICDDATSFAELRDLYLVSRAEDLSAVIPYDLSTASKTQIAVFGANGSGKTVFLRALGTAQILFQAGLPVPARSAVMTVCSGIFSQFSEAEKSLTDADKAGRFEQEARELATMLEAVEAGALVLLNETFQTTAYGEGARGLLPILQYFSHREIRYLLVSHLLDLRAPLLSRGVTLLQTSEGYSLVPFSTIP